MSLFLHVIVFVEDSELRRTLQSLACGKARVILKTPKVCLYVFNLKPNQIKYYLI